MADVYIGIPLERAVQEYAVSALLNVMLRAGGRGYKRLCLPYMRTDTARNKFVESFCALTGDPEDVLVMLDADHNHPQDIADRLAAHSVGVVGALAHRRSEPYDPCAFFRGEDGQLHAIAKWEEGATLLQCAVVGTGAIAIKRWVFTKLEEAGLEWPWFRYYYPPNTKVYPTEDMYFGMCCEAVGIPHYVDVSLCTPHLTVNEIDESSWRDWMADHPGEIVEANVASHAEQQPAKAKLEPARILTRVNV